MKVWLRVIELTSLPLLFLAGLMLASGRAIAGAGSMPREIAVELHTSPLLWGSFGILLVLHSYAGTQLLLTRIKNGKVKVLVDYGVLAFLTYVVWALFLTPLRG